MVFWNSWKALFELNTFRDMINKAVEAQNWNLKNKKFRDSFADFVKASIEVNDRTKTTLMQKDFLKTWDWSLFPSRNNWHESDGNFSIGRKGQWPCHTMDDLNREGEDSIRKAA